MSLCLKGYDLDEPARKRRRRGLGSRAVQVEELDAAVLVRGRPEPKPDEGVSEPDESESDDDDDGLLSAALGSSSGEEMDSEGDDDGLLSAAFGSSSSEDDMLRGVGEHGEMPVARAQRTQAVRVRGVLTPDEITQLLARHEELRDVCGRDHKKHGDGAQNWCTTFLHTDGHFAKAFPRLRKKILRAAAEADEAQGWGLLAAGAPARPRLRCVELHTVGPGGALPQRKHFDHGSLVTVDVLLSPSASFSGGVLQTLEADGSMLPQPFERGEALVFVSHKYHCVTPVTAGQRQVLVAEIWAGRERSCAHRCEQHDGDCPVTLGLSRVVEGEGSAALTELCQQLQSDQPRVRKQATKSLRRLQKLALDPCVA